MKNNVNLNLCKRGQRLMTRCGKPAVYVGCSKDGLYKHSVVVLEEGFYRDVTNTGMYNLDYGNTSYDIVEVFPFDVEQAEVQPLSSTACGIYIRDGRGAVYQLHSKDGKYAWISLKYNWNNISQPYIFYNSANDAMCGVLFPGSKSYLVSLTNITEYKKV